MEELTAHLTFFKLKNVLVFQETVLGSIKLLPLVFVSLMVSLDGEMLPSQLLKVKSELELPVPGLTEPFLPKLVQQIWLMLNVPVHVLTN